MRVRGGLILARSSEHPRLKTLESIAAACGVEACELLEYEDDELVELLEEYGWSTVALRRRFLRLVEARRRRGGGGRGSCGGRGRAWSKQRDAHAPRMQLQRWSGAEYLERAIQRRRDGERQEGYGEVRRGGGRGEVHVCDRWERDVESRTTAPSVLCNCRPGSFRFTVRAISASGVEGVLSAPSAAVVVVAKAAAAVAVSVKKAKPKSGRLERAMRTPEPRQTSIQACLHSGAAKKAWAAERHRQVAPQEALAARRGMRASQLARALPSLRAAAALVSTVVAHPPLSPPSSFPSAASFVALPPLCNHWRVWTASVRGTYVHRAPLLARALPSLRAAAALVSTVVAHPPLSPPSSFPSAASFVALPPLCNHWRVWTASGCGTYVPPRAAARSRAALTPRHLPPLSSPLPPLPATPPSSYAPSFAALRHAAGARTRARRTAAVPAAQRTTASKMDTPTTERVPKHPPLPTPSAKTARPQDACAAECPPPCATRPLPVSPAPRQH